jgi:hypothetical protein
MKRSTAGVFVVILLAAGCRPSSEAGFATLSLQPDAIVQCDQSAPQAGSLIKVRWEIFRQEVCRIVSVEFRPADGLGWVRVFGERRFPEILSKNEFEDWQHRDRVEGAIRLPAAFRLSQAAFLVTWKTATVTDEGAHFIMEPAAMEIPMFAPPPQDLQFSAHLRRSRRITTGVPA